MPEFKHYEGKRYHSYTVIERSYREKGRWYFKCLCDCGNYFYAHNNEFSWKTSCGCLTHTHMSKSKIKHGASETRLYRVWIGMKRRCYNKSDNQYKNYGGKGVVVCDEWKNDYTSFMKWAYANGYDETLKRGKCSIDRINVNGNYEPSNCRWVDDLVQENNRTNNVRVTYQGETHTISEWARLRNIKDDLLRTRIRKGWSIEDAFETPKMNDKHVWVNKLIELLKNNDFVTIDDMRDSVSTKQIYTYIKEIESMGYKLERQWEKSTINGKKTRRMIYRLEGKK